MDRFAPLLEGAIRRFPFLDRVGRDPAALPSRRDDARRQPAARADPRHAGVLGRRRAVAERVRRRRRDRPRARRVDHRRRAGARPQLLPRLALRRPAYRDPWFATAAAREAYRYYYRLRYPFDTDEWGADGARARCRSACRSSGAVFGAKNGWERADHFEPGVAGGGAAPTSAGSAGARRRGSSASGEEHAAFRERVGIIDMTSFGKLEVARPGRAGAARARLRQPHRPARRQRHLHAVPQPPRRDRSPTSR